MVLVYFGIALLSWIFEKVNAIWVFGVYAMVFMVALPVAAGSWWYRSNRYSGTGHSGNRHSNRNRHEPQPQPQPLQVLLDTTQMYYYFFHKTPHMVLKRIVMILAASSEFHKRFNPEIHERPSDNSEVPQLMKHLPQLNEKNKERPLCFSYSVKARALLHAHLTRIPLPPNSLEIDRAAVMRKCPLLLQEMVTCVTQLIMLAHAGTISRLPSLTTIEGCMKLSAMIVQALWDHKSPMLQLPHLEEEKIKYFFCSSEKYNDKSLEYLARLNNEDRRTVLCYLTNDQYADVVKVLGQIPSVDMHVQCEDVDDQNPPVYTAGAIVTVTVTLLRRPFSSLFRKEDHRELEDVDQSVPEDNENEDDKDEKKKPSWESAKKPKKTTPKQAPKNEEVSNPKTVSKEAKVVKDAKWEKLQQSRITRRERPLEVKGKFSHSVHCPFFPEDKQEYWWVYIADRKQQMLLTTPYHVTNLVDREELTLRFTAPLKPGLYTFSVLLRSDSYLGLDQSKDIKMDVKLKFPPNTRSGSYRTAMKVVKLLRLHQRKLRKSGKL